MSAEAGSSAAAGASSASLAAAARELVVPPTPAGRAVVCLEYPGYVGDIANVLQTLGGPETIGRHMQDKQNRTLPLTLRPADRNCRPTFASCEPCSRLLVRLTRPAGARPGDAAGEWAAEVVAAVPRVYRWTTPADYQYVGYDSRPVEEQGLEQQQQEGMHPPGFHPQPIMCAPPLFAKEPQFDYAFRGLVLSGAGAADAAAAKKPRRGAGSGVMASYFDQELPPVLPEAALASARPRLLSAVRALLARRAVWPVAAIAEALAAERLEGGPGAGRALDDLLPKLCYKFRNGPWKGAWTRRGFDPRRDPAARRWQCVEYHLPAEWYSKIAEHKKAAALGEQPAAAQGQGGGAGGIGGALPPVAATYAQLLRFEAVPSTQTCSLQLGGLGDSVVQQLLADPGSHAAQCSDVGGWLTAAAHDAIKRRVKERFAALLAGTPLDDDGGAWSSAAQNMQAGGGDGDSGDPAAAPPQPDAQADAAAASDAARGQADAQLAATAQRQVHVAAPAGRAAAAGGAAPQSILPTRLLEEVRDYLAAEAGGQADGGGGGGGAEAEAEADGGGEDDDDDEDDEEEGDEEEESDEGCQSQEGGARSEED